MAQQKYVNFDAPLTSFEQNIKLLGPAVAPGRVAGFNKLIITGPLTFKLGHDGSGLDILTWKDPTSTVIGPKGAWVSVQGVIIQEDDEIQDTSGTPADFAVLANSSGPYTRYDWVYGRDVYVAGSTVDATYGILTGDATTPEDHIITNATTSYLFGAHAYTHVLLGCIAIPYGTTDLTDPGVRWIPARPKTMGIKSTFINDSAKIGYPNSFMKSLFTRRAPLPVEEPQLDNTATPINGFWQLRPEGNQFWVNPSIGSPKMYAINILEVPLEQGMKITLVIAGNLKIYSGYLPGLTAGARYQEGYRAIYIPERFVNYFDESHGVTGGSIFDTELTNSAADVYHLVELELAQHGYPGVDNELFDSWVITNITNLENHLHAEAETIGTPFVKGAWQFDYQNEAAGGPLEQVLTGSGVWGTDPIVKFNINVFQKRFWNKSWGKPTYGNISSFTIFKSGIYTLSGALRLLIEYTGLSHIYSAYPGFGMSYLVLVVNRPGGGTPTTAYYNLDVLDVTQQRPYWVGLTATPSYATHHLKGSYTLPLFAGDEVRLEFHVQNSAGIQPGFSQQGIRMGDTMFEGKFLGNDYSYI